MSERTTAAGPCTARDRLFEEVDDRFGRNVARFVDARLDAIAAEARQQAPHDCVAAEAEILRLEARQQDGSALRETFERLLDRYTMRPVQYREKYGIPTRFTIEAELDDEDADRQKVIATARAALAGRPPPSAPRALIRLLSALEGSRTAATLDVERAGSAASAFGNAPTLDKALSELAAAEHEARAALAEPDA